MGKSYKMLEDAHELRRQGLDVVVGFIEPHGRAETLGRIADLSRLELAGETVRAALEALAAAAPGWLAGVIDASWPPTIRAMTVWKPWRPASRTSSTSSRRPTPWPRSDGWT